MAFGQYILEMEVFVTEALRNNFEPSPDGELKLYCSDHNQNSST